MAIPENKVTVQTIVDRELAETIDMLAQRMEVSQSRMAAMLLEAAVENEKWAIKMVTGKISKRLIKGFKDCKKIKANAELV